MTESGAVINAYRIVAIGMWDILQHEDLKRWDDKAAEMIIAELVKLTLEAQIQESHQEVDLHLEKLQKSQSHWAEVAADIAQWEALEGLSPSQRQLIDSGVARVQFVRYPAHPKLQRYLEKQCLDYRHPRDRYEVELVPISHEEF